MCSPRQAGAGCNSALTGQSLEAVTLLKTTPGLCEFTTVVSSASDTLALSIQSPSGDGTDRKQQEGKKKSKQKPQPVN